MPQFRQSFRIRGVCPCAPRFRIIDQNNCLALQCCVFAEQCRNKSVGKDALSILRQYCRTSQNGGAMINTFMSPLRVLIRRKILLQAVVAWGQNSGTEQSFLLQLIYLAML